MDETRTQDQPPFEQAAEPIFSNTSAASPTDAGLTPVDGAAPVADAAPSTSPPAAPLPLKPPGPGLPESILWLIGLVIVQIGSGLFGGAAVVAWDVLKHGNEHLTLNGIQELLQTQALTYVAIAQAVFLGITILAAGLRLGAARKLPLRRVSILHLILLFSLIVPMSIVSGEVYRLVDIPWQELVKSIPGLKDLDAANVMKQMEALTKGPWMIVLFAIAFVPAVAEELLFRGVIGRGLTARWGIPAGVLMASILFGLPHGHPVHVVAVIPLGMAMHLAYLSTRSFWSPVLLHFANNAMATGVAYLVKHVSPDVLGADETPVAPAIVAAAAFLSLTTLALLWKTRVRYVLSDGSEWNPGYPTTDAPPAEAGAVAQHHRPAATWYVLGILGVIAFVAALGLFGREALSPP